MSGYGIIAIVAFVIAVLAWLIMGAAIEGVGTRYDSYWEQMRAGWWMLALLFLIAFAVLAVGRLLVGGLVGLVGIFFGG